MNLFQNILKLYLVEEKMVKIILEYGLFIIGLENI